MDIPKKEVAGLLRIIDEQKATISANRKRTWAWASVTFVTGVLVCMLV